MDIYWNWYIPRKQFSRMFWFCASIPQNWFTIIVCITNIFIINVIDINVIHQYRCLYKIAKNIASSQQCRFISIYLGSRSDGHRGGSGPGASVPPTERRTGGIYEARRPHSRVRLRVRPCDDLSWTKRQRAVRPGSPILAGLRQLCPDHVSVAGNVWLNTRRLVVWGSLGLGEFNSEKARERWILLSLVFFEYLSVFIMYSVVTTIPICERMRFCFVFD